MRVDSLSLHNDNEEELVRMDYRGGNRSRYRVKAAFGLDVEELIPNFRGFGAGNTKKKYRVMLPAKKREISLRLVLQPQYAQHEEVSDLRDHIYRTISSSRSGDVELRFNYGAQAQAGTWGYITKCEVAHFSETPELQLTMECDDFMLRGVSRFELSDAAGDFSSTQFINIQDPMSTGPHGFYLRAAFTASHDEFKLTEPGEDWFFHIDNGNPGAQELLFEPGDKIVLSNEYGEKTAQRLQGGAVLDIFDKIQPNSQWPMLLPGANRMKIIQRTDLVIEELSFFPAYWGV